MVAFICFVLLSVLFFLILFCLAFIPAAEELDRCDALLQEIDEEERLHKSK